MSQAVERGAAGLAATRELFDAVLASIRDGVIVYARDGERLWANEQAARIVGAAGPAQLLTAGDDAVLQRFAISNADGTPYDLARLPHRRALAGEDAEPELIRFREGDGPERVSEVTAVAVRDDAGAPLYAISFFREVTEDAEAAKTSALLDALYTSAPVGLGFWDRDLRYVRVNEALAAINERAVEDHIGRPFTEVIPQLAHIIEPIARRVLETGESVIALEMTGGTPQDPGSVRHWRASYYPVTGADGAIYGVGAVVEETTARRRAEQRTELQHTVTRILTEADSVAGALALLLETVCETLGWDVACYWSVDPDDTRVTWARPGVHAEGFIAMTERASLTPALLPGRVAQAGAPEWLEELEPERFPRSSVAHAEGLTSGVAFPVLIEGEAVGVLELFAQTRQPRDPALERSLTSVGAQVGQFLRRKRAEEERQQLLARERVARAEAEAAFATLRKLSRVSEAALEHLSLHDLLNALLDRIVEVLEADTAAILLFGEDEQLHVRASHGLERELGHELAIPLGAGMAGRVAQTRAPLLVPDLGQIELVSPVLRERGINSLVAIPLIVEERVIGVVHAGSIAFAQFTDEDARLLELIADRIALAINQATLYEAERVAQERLQFLAEASATLAASLDVEATLQRIAQLAVPHFADWCVVDLVARDGSLERVAVAHADPAHAEHAQRIIDLFPSSLEDEFGIGKVIRERVPSLRREPDIETLRQNFPDHPEYVQLMVDLNLRSLVTAPLVVRNESLGAVTFVWSDSERIYDEADVRLAQELASRAAVAVDNARLYREAEHRRDRLAVLAEASAILGSSLDVDSTLDQLGALLVGRVAVGCAIHLASETTVPRLVGSSGSVAIDDADVLRVIRTGEPALGQEGRGSLIVVPMQARGRTFGALSLAWEADTAHDERDLDFALDLGRRAGVAIDNAQLFRAAEERAQAARVLASVGDGVFLVDRSGCVRTWNRAAAAATGLRAVDVVDRPAVDVIPGWSDIVSRIPLVATGTGAPRAESLPLEIGGRELWLSLHGVTVSDGVVYAFRDLTEERALESMRTEFVSTVSHELRTPLAAIYGAAMTLRRSDVALDDEQRAKMLDVVSGEADRLARTVNDILWASRLDTDSLHVTIQNCDPRALAEEVVAAQRTHLDRGHDLVLELEDDLPSVAGDPDKVGRVLINLVDNAVKYSPDGGRVDVGVRVVGSHVRFSISDPGLGVPASEQRRIFEKFYRLDPNMNRGVGGTGLGLYICRELVRRMEGRIWVDSQGLGRGSTFHVELPVVS